MANRVVMCRPAYQCLTDTKTLFVRDVLGCEHLCIQNERTDDLRFYAPFNSVSVVSGRLAAGYNESHGQRNPVYD